jgi:CspA family cold shock protein
VGAQEGERRVTTKFHGTVTHWNADRGFGFIKRESDQTQFFAHISDVDEAFDSLTRGQRVDFAIVESDRKPGAMQAVEIDVVEMKGKS